MTDVAIDDRRQYVLHHAVARFHAVALVHAAGAGAEDRRVRLARVVPCRGVVVERDGHARLAPGMVHRLWVAVKGGRAGVETHHPVEARYEARNLAAHVVLPDLEGPAPLLAPVLVEIDQDVQPALKVELRMVVEIGMDIEMPAIGDHMDAAAGEVRVRDQPVDAGQPLQKHQERPRIERVEEVARVGRQAFGNVLGFQLFPGVVEGLTRLGHLAELMPDPIENLGRQKIVEATMGIGRAGAILQGGGTGGLDRSLFWDEQGFRIDRDDGLHGGPPQIYVRQKMPGRGGAGLTVSMSRIPRIRGRGQKERISGLILRVCPLSTGRSNASMKRMLFVVSAVCH